jgi:hypothetical protein
MTTTDIDDIKAMWARVAPPTVAAKSTARQRLRATTQGRRGRHGRVRLVIGLAVVLGLLAAVPAMSGTGYGFVVHWLTGAPPKEVTDDIARIDQGAPPGMAQHPIVGKTGLVYDRATPDGRVRIWLTPTKSGGFCESFEAPWRGDGKTLPMSGGCFPARMQRPIETRGNGGGTDFALGFINGRVAPPITRLGLRYVNGNSEDVPVQGGFFVAVVQKTRILRITDHPSELIGYESGGKVVARTSVANFYGESPFGAMAPPIAEVERERPLLSVALDDGSRAMLSQSPSRSGGECDRISTGETNWSWTCADASALPQPIRLGVVRPAIHAGRDAATLLYGVIRHGLAARFHYEDGTSEPIPLTTDRFLVDLSKQHRREGGRLAEITVAEGGRTVLSVPIATKDDSLYSPTPDRSPQGPMRQIFNPADAPVVATLKLAGSHGETLTFVVRRETPTHWYEVLLVDGRAVSGENLRWFAGGHDATIGFEWQPMRKPEFAVDKPLSLLMGHIRSPATEARVVYADGSIEPVELARPSDPTGHGISGWFVYEFTSSVRVRKPARFEALDRSGKVIDTAKPPPGA